MLEKIRNKLLAFLIIAKKPHLYNRVVVDFYECPLYIKDENNIALVCTVHPHENGVYSLIVSKSAEYLSDAEFDKMMKGIVSQMIHYETRMYRIDDPVEYQAKKFDQNYIELHKELFGEAPAYSLPIYNDDLWCKDPVTAIVLECRIGNDVTIVRNKNDDLVRKT